MKQYSYIVFVFLSLNIFSQDFDKKIINSTSKLILIELASIQSIELKMHETTDRIEVQYNNADTKHTPLINDDGSTVHIKVSKNAYDLEGTEKNKYRAGQPTYPNYRIYLPKNADVKLFYEKGNMRANNFIGKLDLRITTGEVRIDQFNGTLNIQSFSGSISCNLKAAKINVSASRGTIHSTLQDSRLVKTQTSLKGIFNNANNVLKINTIHAKVNLKTMSTQK